MEDHAAPTVEDVDFELSDVLCRGQLEHVVDAVVVGRCDGVGQVDVERADVVDGDFAAVGAPVEGGGDAVGAFVGYGYVLRVGAGAPHVRAVAFRNRDDSVAIVLETVVVRAAQTGVGQRLHH